MFVRGAAWAGELLVRNRWLMLAAEEESCPGRPAVIGCWRVVFQPPADTAPWHRAELRVYDALDSASAIAMPEYASPSLTTRAARYFGALGFVRLRLCYLQYHPPSDFGI